MYLQKFQLNIVSMLYIYAPESTTNRRRMKEEVTTTMFYEKFEEERKEASKLRHEQNNTYNKLLLKMENKMEDGFDKIEKLIQWNHKEIKETYATKDEVKIVKSSNDRIWKIIWAVIWFVFLWLWGIMTAVISFYLKNQWS